MKRMKNQFYILKSTDIEDWKSKLKKLWLWIFTKESKWKWNR